MSKTNSHEWPPVFPYPIPVIKVTGHQGSGKTTFGLTIAPTPPNAEKYATIVYDLEQGSKTYQSQFGFDHVDLASDGYAEAWVKFVKSVKGMKKGEYAVAVIDPEENLEEGCVEYIMKNPSEFNATLGQLTKNGSPTPIFWGKLKALLGEVLNELASKVQTVVIVNHIRQQFQGNAPVAGKFEAKGKDIISKMSSVVFWLTRAHTGAPMATVMKSRLTKSVFDKDQENPYAPPKQFPMLPNTITDFSPQRLRDYMLSDPKEFTEKELAFNDPSRVPLTPEQRAALLETKRQIEEENEKRRVVNDLIDRKIFTSMDELGQAVKETGATFSLSKIAEFQSELVEHAKQKYPERFGEGQNG